MGANARPAERGERECDGGQRRRRRDGLDDVCRDEQFQTEVRARDYYSFVTLTTVSMGILFQVPVGVLAVTKLGLVTPRQLRKNRRYAYLACTVVAARRRTSPSLTSEQRSRPPMSATKALTSHRTGAPWPNGHRGPAKGPCGSKPRNEPAQAAHTREMRWPR